MKPCLSCFLSLLIKLFPFFLQKKIIACRIIASVVKTRVTKVLIRRGLNYRKTVETDNTDFCC